MQSSITLSKSRGLRGGEGFVVEKAPHHIQRRSRLVRGHEVTRVEHHDIAHVAAGLREPRDLTVDHPGLPLRQPVIPCARPCQAIDHATNTQVVARRPVHVASVEEELVVVQQVPEDVDRDVEHFIGEKVANEGRCLRGDAERGAIVRVPGRVHRHIQRSAHFVIVEVVRERDRELVEGVASFPDVVDERVARALIDLVSDNHTHTR